MDARDFTINAAPETARDRKHLQDRVTRASRISAQVSLSWRSNFANHIDSRYCDNLDVRRDYFPLDIEAQLDGCAAGAAVHGHFGPGEVLSELSPARVHTVKHEQFNRNFAAHMRLEPRLGRFYPGGIFENIPGNHSSNYQPSRIIAMDDQTITVDFNHPLAAKALDLDIRVLSIREAGQEPGGRCTGIVETLAANGPGMQARYDDIATDFWSDDPFARADTSPDDRFYAQPRLVEHLDFTCSRQIGELYEKLLPHEGDILDLMSSWVSHLPAEFASARITGLGMNMQELERNPLLASLLVHDLNRRPALPFDDNAFDGIACTASVEYLVSPAAVFSELARILRPGAPLVITFSNRWFPPKAIRAWGQAHEFERIGLVLEYFIQDGGFENLHTYSLRGLPRPPADRYADQLPLSDPVYAVWGFKR